MTELFRLSHNPPLTLCLCMGEELRGKGLLKVDPSRLLIRMPSLTGTDSLTECLYMCVLKWQAARQISICFFPQRQAAHTFTLTNHCLDWWSACIYWLIIHSRYFELYRIVGIDNLHFYMGKRFWVQHWHTLHMLWFQTPRFTFTHGWEADESGWKWREKGRERDKGREVRARFGKQTVTPRWKESTIPFNDNHVSRSLLWSEKETSVLTKTKTK